MYAAEMGHLEVVKELLKHQAKVNAQDENKDTALHRACSLGSIEIVKELIEHGADPTLTNSVSHYG
jgi:ankyrin repeat protein